MSSVRWLQSIAVACALAAPWVPASAQVKWDLASANPPTNFQTTNLDRFVEDLDRRTNGALKVTHHSNASLFKMAEIRRATQRGQVAIGEVLLGTMVNEFPLLAFDAVPFLFNSREEGIRFWNEIRPFVEKRLAEQGLTLLYVQPWQPQGLYSTKEVKGVADLKGTRFRAHSPVFAKYAQAVGAQPLSIPYTELSQAIFTGAVDTMMTGITAAADLKFWKSMPYYYDVQASFTHNIIFANSEKFNALPEPIRAEIRKASAAAEQAAVQNVIALEAAQVKMVTENGMKVLQPDPKLKQEMQAAAKGIIEEWLQQAGPEAQRALAAIRR
jgi:TRAP-type C4-dicarboxylate transport system substrate-binding protein